MHAPATHGKLISMLLLAALAVHAAAALDAPAGEPVEVVAVIPVMGLIDKGLYGSIKRRIVEAKALDPALIIFEIDTYGGLVDAAIEITDEIGRIETPKTVAFIPTKAISAGAMIALAAQEIVLTPSSAIGDAAPVMPTQEGTKMLGEKEQSPVRNKFRNYAQKHGYPEALVEAMVSAEIEVVEATYKDGTKKYFKSKDYEEFPDAEKADVEKTRVVVREGELLTATATEALAYGIAAFIVRDIDELLVNYGLGDADVVTFDVNWSEELVRKLNHPLVASIILLVGIMGIYMEFKIPGFGLPGTVGIICLAIFFFSKYLSGLAQSWEILIFVVGLALLAIEIFVIPGFGITGFLGMTLIIISLALALLPANITFAPIDIHFLTVRGLYFVATLVVAFIVGVGLAKVLPKIPVVGKFYLGAPEPESVPHAAAAPLDEQAHHLMGKVGRALTNLRPAGRAIIDGEPYDVTTEGDLVPKDALVEVINTKGNNIIVKEAK